MHHFQRYVPYILPFILVLTISIVFQSGLFLEILFGIIGDVPELSVYSSIILVVGSLYVSPVLGAIFAIYVYVHERRACKKTMLNAICTASVFFVIHPLITWNMLLSS